MLRGIMKALNLAVFVFNRKKAIRSVCGIANLVQQRFYSESFIIIGCIIADVL